MISNCKYSISIGPCDTFSNQKGSQVWKKRILLDQPFLLFLCGCRVNDSSFQLISGHCKNTLNIIKPITFLGGPFSSIKKGWMTKNWGTVRCSADDRVHSAIQRKFNSLVASWAWGLFHTGQKFIKQQGVFLDFFELNVFILWTFHTYTYVTIQFYSQNMLRLL